jgi:hypothetical protein
MVETNVKGINIFKDAFPGNIYILENLVGIVNKKRNILYDNTIYPCADFVWLVYDDDAIHFTLYRRTRHNGVITTMSIRLYWYYFYGYWLGLTSPTTANKQMMKWLCELYIYAYNLDIKKPFHSIRTDIQKYWLEQGCYLNTSVFRIIIRVFIHRTYLTPELDGCSTRICD